MRPNGQAGNHGDAYLRVAKVSYTPRRCAIYSSMPPCAHLPPSSLAFFGAPEAPSVACECFGRSPIFSGLIFDFRCLNNKITTYLIEGPKTPSVGL